MTVFVQICQNNQVLVQLHCITGVMAHGGSNRCGISFREQKATGKKTFWVRKRILNERNSTKPFSHLCFTSFHFYFYLSWHPEPPVRASELIVQWKNHPFYRLMPWYGIDGLVRGFAHLFSLSLTFMHLLKQVWKSRRNGLSVGKVVEQRVVNGSSEPFCIAFPRLGKRRYEYCALFW